MKKKLDEYIELVSKVNGTLRTSESILYVFLIAQEAFKKGIRAEDMIVPEHIKRREDIK